MFGIFKRKSRETEEAVVQLPFQTDIHSHILPGIDDGSPDVETSVRLIRGLVKLGIRKSIATPHVISDMYRNTPDTIRNALDTLRPVLKQEEIDIEIGAAAEYMLDDYFVKLLRNGGELLTLRDRIILTEQSYATAASNLNEISFELITAGYKPIMAHPERYHFYHGDYKKYSHIKDMGFSLQVNLLSIVGYYGKPVARAARHLLDEGLVDYVGTDLHHDRHLAALSAPESLRILDKYLGGKQFNQLI
jgi:tyrosine-protein phosphatase YwqE